LAVRRRIRQVSSNVAFSLDVPIRAFLPAEHLGASGLVAAVVAGLVTGDHTAKHLPSEVRIAEHAVWRTVELLLESAIFLLMGLQLFALHEDAVQAHQDEWLALGLGAAAAGVVVVIRSVFVFGAVWLLGRRAKRMGRRQERITLLTEWLDEAAARPDVPLTASGHESMMKRRGSLRRLLERQKADLDYLSAERFGWKDGVVLVSAGMRGAITLAAAQSLPLLTPYRSLLILTAFVVAAGTLLLQGGTLNAVVKALKMPSRDPLADEMMQAQLGTALSEAALEGLESGRWRRADGSEFSPAAVRAARSRIEAALHAEGEDAQAYQSTEVYELRLEVIEAQRAELLRIRDLGTFPSDVLETRLSRLDAEQIGVESWLR
jgi:CPA1 family monovalent cation:H+ antiporter